MKAASARRMVMTCLGLAPIARSSPTSRWRSRTIAENNKETTINNAASWNAVNAAMPSNSAPNPCREEVSTPLPSTILTSGSWASANLTSSTLAPGASCSRKAETRSSGRSGEQTSA